MCVRPLETEAGPSPHWSAAAQGETKVLKLKNLRPQDYASYTCQVSVRNVCGIPDKAVTFRLTNTTGTGTPLTPILLPT